MKILQLEIESCDSCPYKQTGFSYRFICMKKGGKFSNVLKDLWENCPLPDLIKDNVIPMVKTIPATT